MDNDQIHRRVSEREAASYLGIAQRTVQDFRLRRVGPPYFKLGKRIVYDLADLDAFLAAGRVEPKAA
ncbi:MAG: DNA-binding protein [Xanthomonas sp.]|nr:DNA-binding protein [Xanthomonas sp.]